MNSRRTVILIIAIVVSALSALGLSQYVQGLEDDVYDGAALGMVWQVKAEIPKGTPAEQAIGQGLIQQVEVPVEFIPPTYIKDPGVELNNLVAVVNLPPSSILVAGNFVTPNVINTGILDRLEERGMHTVTITVDQVSGAAFFIEPGDFVNVISKRPYEFQEVTDEQATAEGGEGTPGGEGDVDTGLAALAALQNEYRDPTQAYPFPEEGLVGPVPQSEAQATYLNEVRYVYQKAEVIAVGNALPLDLGESATEEQQNAARGGLITLAVPYEAVQTILAIGSENLYLSLVPESYEPVEILPLDFTSQRLPGEDERRLTPYYATEDRDDAPAE